MEQKEIIHMSTFTLEPQFDSRKSFYGKAKVSIIGEKAILTSYNTEVAEIHFDHFNERNGDKAIVHGDYSPTTLRHIKEFLLQYGFKAESKAQILADYTIYKCVDILDESESFEGNLQDVKDWLIDFWNFNPDEDMSDKEHAKLVKDIQKCKTSTKLNDFLGGIDWYMEQI